MGNIVIVTDSTADLSKEMIEENGIIVLPLTVTYKGRSYKDGVDLTIDELIDFLNESEELPKTSQVNPQEFYEVYKKLIDQGKEIISIHLSSLVSGTYQSANIAKDMLNSDKIHIIDSKVVSFGTGLLVHLAVKLIKQNKDINEIVKILNDYSKKVRIAFVVDDLEYIKKGGRLSGAQATIAKILNIKPIIHMEDGKLYVHDKVRGFKRAIDRLAEYLEEMKVDSSMPVGVGTVSYFEERENLRLMVKERYNISETLNFIAGSVIATYSGPGVVGICFFSK